MLGGSLHWQEAALESDIIRNGNPATYYVGSRPTPTPGVGRLALNADPQSKEDFSDFTMCLGGVALCWDARFLHRSQKET